MPRIKAFLLFHHIQKPSQAKTEWCRSYRQWLKSRPAPRAELNDCLQLYLAELENLEALLQQLKEQILALGRTDRYRPACDRLTRQIPGVGPLTVKEQDYHYRWAA